MTRFRKTALAVTLALSAAAAYSAPVTYTFDTVHSRVTFYVNHLGFSNSVGEFKLADGTFAFDNDNWSNSKVTVKLPVQSLELGTTEWNGHIQGKDWLDLSQYPDITFQSTKVEKTDATHGKLSGNLTIRGVTKPITLNLTLNKVGEHFLRKTQAAGFTATGTVKRSEFGVVAYAGAIGEDVDLRIEVESYVDKPAAK